MAKRTEFLAFHALSLEDATASLNERLQELAPRKPDVKSVHYQAEMGKNTNVYHHILVMVEIQEEGYQSPRVSIQ